MFFDMFVVPLQLKDDSKLSILLEIWHLSIKTEVLGIQEFGP
jgi:hypothetical protein